MIERKKKPAEMQQFADFHDTRGTSMLQKTYFGLLAQSQVPLKSKDG